MPLAFQSISHGRVAFGFFNIETDMLLLERLFFFADRLCAAIVELCEGDAAEATIEGWRLAPSAVGDLHGAIAGVRFAGFIGACYRRYPFPAEPEGFRQSPEGDRTQAELAALIAGHGQAEAIPLRWRPGAARAAIGELEFSGAELARLVAYLERGGYPRWRDERRPGYVARMARAFAEATPAGA